jgi:hypothetical protein
MKLIDVKGKTLRRKDKIRDKKGKLIEHLPRGNYGMEKSSGSGLPTHPPSHQGIIQDSGSLGFRFPYGCGAAGALNPLPLTIRLIVL